MLNCHIYRWKEQVSCLTTIFSQKIWRITKKLQCIRIQTKRWRHFHVAFTGNISCNILQWNRRSELLDFCFEKHSLRRPKRGFQWEYSEKYHSENMTLSPCYYCRRRVNLFWCLHLLISSDLLFSKLSPLYEAISSFSLRHR